nr:zinc finger, CCHC-type [Tanacetum cinerariifolium]
MTTKFEKLDKFEGNDFRRWQKKMHFLLTTLKVVYVLKDGSSKKFLVSNFNNYKMVDSSIIDKLPPSWKDFKHTLKHNKDELSLVQLESHFRIEKTLKAKESGKGKGKEIVASSLVNMIEDGKNKNNNKNTKGKKRNNDGNNDGSNKKSKLTCWKCGKTGHFKRNCLVKRTMVETLLVRDNDLRILIHHKDDPFAWWIDSGAHVMHKEAINDEMDSIMENNTWILSDLPPATFNLVINQIDVKTAFLNGDLEEVICMKQSEGFIMPGNVHKGFVLKQSDKCVYCKFDKSDNGVIICLYVDGMLIFWTNQDQVDKTKEFLLSIFFIKDMGEADVILGIRIKREDKGIKITQSHYIEKILKKFKCDDCCPVSTPLDSTIKLMPNTSRDVDQLEYSKAIGCLMYAMTSTTPDIAYDVGKLSRNTSNPSTYHWYAIMRVFNYLNKTVDYGLSYVGFPSVLEGYSDASWITNLEDHTSTNGWLFLLSRGAILWAFKKQTCIIDSTMEAEFVALVVASKEAEWLRNLIYEIL